MNNQEFNDQENNPCCGSACGGEETALAETHKPTFYATETNSGLNLEIDLPGVNKSDTKITSEENQLTVLATRKSSTPDTWNLLNQSNNPTDYKLILNLNPKLDLAKTKAAFQNGTLILEIPKKEEALPKQIDILN